MPKINEVRAGTSAVPPADPIREKYGEWTTKYTLLSSTLQLAVPLWIERLRGAPWEHVERRARECSQVIAEHGDNLLFRSKKKGDTAEAFNRLAEGIACLSFCPGGVKIFGEHWEAVLEDAVPERSRNVLTALCAAVQRVLNDAKG